MLCRTWQILCFLKTADRLREDSLLGVVYAVFHFYLRLLRGAQSVCSKSRFESQHARVFLAACEQTYDRMP